MKRVTVVLILVVASLMAGAGSARAQTGPAPGHAPLPPRVSLVPVGYVPAQQFGAISGSVTDLTTEWARLFGWTPSKPIAVRVYTNGLSMASDAGFYRLFPLTNDELVDVSHRPGIGVRDARPVLPGGGSGGWVILLNLNPGSIVNKPVVTASETELRGALTREMARAMLGDIAGPGGPAWFREGILSVITNTKVLGLDVVGARLSAWSAANGSGTLPSVVDLDRQWQLLLNAPAGPARDVPFAVADQSVFFLTQRVGMIPLLQTLQRTSAGEDFESALQNTTGYTLARLETEYRSWMQAAVQ